MSQHEFLCCGLGAGARGFIEAAARLGKDQAKFRNLGGIDIDPLSCEDFTTLTGGKATVADLSKMTPADLRKAWGRKTPDAIFLSPPCKGYSSLLPKETAKAEKYQALNRLVVEGMFLACETWDTPPSLLVLENVPRITTRGAELLDKVRKLLHGYGYVFHEATHDCGEIGGLAQHRVRYLMVARLPSACGAYVYRPPKKKVRPCGEVLGELPLPEDPRAGDLHRLPKLSWLNWMRLARIPPGGDWRDLERPLPGTPEDDARKAWEQKGEKKPGGRHWFKGKHHMGKWERPSRTVVGGPSNGAQNVADPRLAVEKTNLEFGGALGVLDWKEPSKTVTGNMQPTGSRTPANVADPRPLAVNKRKGRFNDQYKLRGWDEAAGTVTGNTDIQEGAQSVADPRLALEKPAFGHAHKVTGWDEAAGTVTHSPSPASGGGAVADPRLSRDGDNTPFNDQLRVDGWEDPVGAVTSSHRKAVADPRGLELAATAEGAGSFKGRPGLMGVGEWEEPAQAITGRMNVSGGNCTAAVADPRVQLEHSPHNDSYGVTPWQNPAATVRGASSVRTSKSAVADPRIALPENDQRHWNKFRVDDWEEPAGTVTGARPVSSGGPAVADPRLGTGQGPGGHNNKMAIADWTEPAPTVIGATRPGGGAASVADPRLGTERSENMRSNQMPVGSWDDPARTVTGAARPGAGAPSVAEPVDVRLTCAPRSGVYGVLSWEQAAATITGSAKIDNGSFAIADPRKPPPFIPVILSPWDGTWHRPLTTLELAALQSLPTTLNGKPLKLAGTSVAKFRERIGNAVPVHAGMAIAETLLLALLAARLGTWTLGSTGIWVRKDGVTEDQANAPYEIDSREVA